MCPTVRPWKLYPLPQSNMLHEVKCRFSVIVDAANAKMAHSFVMAKMKENPEAFIVKVELIQGERSILKSLLFGV